MTTPPCKIRWTGPTCTLPSPTGGESMGHVAQGAEGVLVYPNLASFSPNLALLYRVDPSHYEVIKEEGSNGAFGGWDGTTVTPELLKALLDLDDAIPTLVQVMAENPALGPKVVQGVMSGMG